MTIMKSLNDLAGGLIAAFIGLPQAIILGIVVFSPLQSTEAIQLGISAGIVAVVVGGLAAGIIGGMPLLITGPRASASFILASLVKDLTERLPQGHSGIPDHLLAWLFLCVLLAGMLQVVLSAIRADRLIRRIPDPVSNTFTLIIGIVIILDQLPPIVTGHYGARPTLLQIPDLLSRFQPAALMVGVLTLLAILMIAYLPVLKNRSVRLGEHTLSMTSLAPLLGLVLGMGLFHLAPAAGLAGQGVTLADAAQLGSINRYLAHAFETLPPWNEQIAVTVGIHAVLLALMGALDTMIAGSALESKFDARNQSQRELLGQGIANIMSAAAGGIAVVGSLQRGQASAELGARTSLAGAASALFILAMVTVGWPWVGQLAIGVLAAMLAFTGIQMVMSNFQIRREWKLATQNQRQEEGITNLLTIAVMLVPALLLGAKLIWVTLAGIGVTIGGLLYKLSSKPVFRVYTHKQRRSTELRSMQNRQRLDDSASEIKIMELAGDLIFASTTELQERINAEYPDHAASPTAGQKHYLILDFSRVHEMDDTGTRTLAKCVRRLKQQHVDVRLSYISNEGASAYRQEQLRRVDFDKLCPNAHCYEDTDHALEAVEDEILNEHAHEWKRELDFAELPFCGGLDAQEIAMLEAYFEAPVTTAKGGSIFEQGQEADGLYVLCSGDVKLQTSSSADSVKRIAQLNPGAIFGSDAINGYHNKRVATAFAREASTARKLNNENLARLENRHPRLALQVQKAIAAAFADRISSVAREMEMADA